MVASGWLLGSFLSPGCIYMVERRLEGYQSLWNEVFGLDQASQGSERENDELPSEDVAQA